MSEEPVDPSAFEPAHFDVLYDAAFMQEAIDRLAGRLVPRLSDFGDDGSWTVVTILLGAIPFSADLMRALAVRGCHPSMDALWLESYAGGFESSGRVAVRADVARSVSGRGVLLLDDVFDTGRTLAFARTHLLAKGAREVLSVAMARKPSAPQTGLDDYAIETPERFLVGLGMDVGGRFRGIPFIGGVRLPS
jgi:hypoxanthine phosphoribosyltransferase